MNSQTSTTVEAWEWIRDFIPHFTTLLGMWLLTHAGINVEPYWLFVQLLLQIDIKAGYHWPFMRGHHQWLVDSPHKEPVMQKMFPWHDVLMKFLNSVQVYLFTPCNGRMILIPKWSIIENFCQNILVCKTLLQTLHTKTNGWHHADNKLSHHIIGWKYYFGLMWCIVSRRSGWLLLFFRVVLVILFGVL